MPQLNHPFKIALTTFVWYKKYITNAIELPYSNAKLEATTKLIKDIKRNAFGYRNFDNFKKRIYLALNIKKARTTGSIISVVGKSTVEIMEPFLV